VHRRIFCLFLSIAWSCSAVAADLSNGVTRSSLKVRDASGLRAALEAAIESNSVAGKQRLHATGYVEQNLGKVRFGETIEVEFHEGPAGRSGQDWLDVWLYQVGAYVGAVRVYVGREIMALVSRHTLERHAQMSCADFDRAYVDARRVPARDIAVEACSAATEGQDLRRAFAAGDVLMESDLIVRPLVIEGASVRVRTRVAAVQIEETGRALADAQIGQRVRVRVGNSPDPVEGLVGGDGVVEVGI
jgi:flagella basal body P-ring formation protein FlgA